MKIAKQERNDLLLIFGAALLLRVLAAWWLGSFWEVQADGRYDDGAYIDMARGFLGLKESNVITHPPGLAFLLVPFMMMGKWGVPAAFLSQWTLGAAIAPLTYLLARAMKQKRLAAVAAGAAIAVNPLFIYFSTRLLAESLFIVLVLSFFLAWHKAWSEESRGWASIAGVLGAMASLTRGVMLPFGGVLAIVAFFRRRERKTWSLLVVICGFSWAAVMSTWVARNYNKYGRFIPVSVQGGWNLYEGLTVDQDEIRKGRPEMMGQEARAQGLEDVFAIDAYFQKKANAWISENPGRFALLGVKKAVKFWRLFPYPPHPPPVRLAVGLFTGLIFGLALLALWKGAVDSPLMPLVFSWVFYLTALHSVFASNLRYRMPVDPFVAILAGAGFALLLRGRK